MDKSLMAEVPGLHIAFPGSSILVKFLRVFLFFISAIIQHVFDPIIFSRGRMLTIWPTRRLRGILLVNTMDELN